MNRKTSTKRTFKMSFLALLMAVAICLMTGCGGSTDSTSASDGSENADASAKNSYSVGETYEDSSIKVTFVSVEEDFTGYSEYSDVPAGKKVLKATFDFENVGSSDYLADETEFDCFADNESCESFYSVDDYGFSDNLSAGRKATGRNVYFLIPENASSITIEFEANFLTDKKVNFIVK